MVAVAIAAEVLAVAVLQLLVVADTDELHVRASFAVCSRDEVAVVVLAVLPLADQAVVVASHVQLPLAVLLLFQHATWATAAVAVTLPAVQVTLVADAHGELVVDLAAVASAVSVVCSAVQLQVAAVQSLA